MDVVFFFEEVKLTPSNWHQRIEPETLRRSTLPDPKHIRLGQPKCVLWMPLFNKKRF